MPGVLLVLAALCLPALPAIAADKPLTAYNREVWTTRQGLPHNQVNAIAQSKDGYLWLGTWEGLVRYNGLEFHTFERANTPALHDNGIRSVRTAADGSIVVGTSRGGVSILSAGTWRHLGMREGLAQDEIMDALIDRKGRLWVATESAGVSMVAEGRVTQLNVRTGLPSNIAYGLLEDRDGSLWVATAGGLAHVVDGRVQAPGDMQGLPRAPAFHAIQLRNGDLVVGTERGAFRGRAGRFQALSPALPVDGVPSLAEDALGNLWIGTVNNGLLRLAGKRVDAFSAEHGLPNNRVASLQVDAEGSVWAGTNSGLLRLSDAPFTTWNGDQGLTDDYVRTLVQAPGGGIWIGTGRGLNLWRGNQVVERYTAAEGLPGDSILSLLPLRDGSLLVGSYTVGAYRMREGRVVEHFETAGGMPGSNQVRALAQGADGTLWIGTTRGLARRRNGVFTAFTMAEGMPRDFVISLHTARDGSLWVGTANGAARIVGETVQALEINAINGAQDVFDFHEDADGTLWMATDRGLLRYRRGQLAGIGIANGLPVDTLFSVVDDGLGTFWLTSNRGVLRVQRAQVEAAMAGRRATLAVDHFGEADGLVSAQCNGGSGPAALRDSAGNVWVATARGAAVVAPRQLHSYRHVLPRVALEQVLANDTPVALGDPLRLPAGTTKLEFRYAALSFLAPRFLHYRYRLHGVDTEWRIRGNERVAQYTNLGAGNYRFDVNVAAPSLGHDWSDSITSVDVEIAPQPWQRRGVQAAIALAVLLLGWAIYRWHLGTLRRRASQLEQLVERRTVDIREQTARLREADAEKSSLLQRLREQSEAFERMALEDALTGIGNRRNFDRQLGRAFRAAVEAGKPMSFALFDIDDFKRLNDLHSHAAGDRALVAVAHALRDGVGAHGEVARWGGEEFAVLLPDMSLPDARALCERLLARVEAIDCSAYAPGWTLTASAGVTERTGVVHHERLVGRADALLYEAKRAGRNRICG